MASESRGRLRGSRPEEAEGWAHDPEGEEDGCGHDPQAGEDGCAQDPEGEVKGCGHDPEAKVSGCAQDPEGEPEGEEAESRSPEAALKGGTSRERKGDWRKTGQKKAGRPRKRGRRSEEAKALSEAWAEGNDAQRLQTHTELRDEPEVLERKRKQKFKDKQRVQKAVAKAGRAAAGGGKKPEPKKPGAVKHVVGKVEQLDPAVYARMVKLMGKARLEEFVRNAGNEALGRELGRRYKGPATEAEMMALLRGLRERRGEGILRKVQRLAKELGELTPERNRAKESLKGLDLVDCDGNPINVQVKAKADEVLERYAQKEQELADAKKDQTDVKKAKTAYARLWYRRRRKLHISKDKAYREKKKRKAAEWERKRSLEVILKAKARATQWAYLHRRVKLMRHMRGLAAEQRKDVTKLNALSGTGERKQLGDKFQRVAKQSRFEKVLAKMMFQRSQKLIRKHVRVTKREEVAEEREKLQKRVKKAMRCAMGHKTQLMKDFVKSYGYLWDEVERLRVETQKEVKAGQGLQTYEELLRPEKAQVHRKGQKPYGWLPLESDGEMVTATESEAEDQEAEQSQGNKGGSQQTGGKAGAGGGKDAKPEQADKKPKSYKKKLKEMRARARRRQRAKLAKDAEQPDAQSSQQAASSTRKMRKKQQNWGEKDNCVCGPQCHLPKQWSERMMKKLLKLRPYRGNVKECLDDMMSLEECPGCWRELGQPCLLGDGCEDVVKLCLSVRPHSLAVAELLDDLIYPVKVVMRSILTLEKAMVNGKVEKLEKLLSEFLDPKKAGEKGAEAQTGGSALPTKPMTDGVELEEKYGHLMKAFREREQDHPIHVCYWCERRLTAKRMEVLSLKSLEDRDEKRMQDKTKESLLARLEERLQSEGMGQKPEDVFPMGICKACYVVLAQGKVKGPMVENGFYTDAVPKELEDLNPYELMMVCLAKPFYTCVRLKTVRGRGKPSELLKATRGNVAHLRIPIEETLDHVMKTVEPVVNNPSEYLTIYADVKTRAKTVWRNLVNMDKVIRALEYLKKTNRLYRKIKVDREGLKKLKASEFVKLAELDKASTVDGNLEAEADEEEEAEEAEEEAAEARGKKAKETTPAEAFLTQDGDHRLDAEFSMQPLNAEKVAVGEDVDAYTAANRYRQKDIKGEPLRAQKEADLDLMSFPQHFPKGRYGLGHKRQEPKVRPAEYFKYRIQNKDPRWRRDQTWLHAARYFKLEREVFSGVYASMHMGAESAKLNREQMLKKLRGQDGSEQLAVDMSSALACMKGTPEYWKKKSNILRTMDEELGPATWFVTLSCAEGEWAELRRLLLLLNEDMTGAAKLTTNELCVLDPVTVSEFFKRRMDGFLSEVLLTKDGPLGPVKDWFWRLEYQARGAPHVHMKLWVEGAPILGEEGVTEEKVLDFIQRHETCAIPSLEENKELYEKVMKFQMHKCNRRCQRFRKGKGKRVYQYCRFGFPRAVRPAAVLNSLEKTVKESSKGRGVKKLYELARSSAETNVNNYNPMVLLGWNANVDVQFVGENSMILNKYITGYITKAEKGQTQQIWDAMGSDKSPAARLTKLMFECNKSREVGTYEIADDLLGNPLHGSSVSVQYLGVGLPGKRTRALKKFKDLEAGEGGGELYQDNLIDVYYPQRSDELESLSLYECVAEWKVEKEKEPKKALEEEAAWRSHLSKLSGKKRDKALKDRKKNDSKGKLSRDGKTRMKRRTKRILVSTRYIPAMMERAEEFFQQLLMLHVPFRDEMELKREKETWREAYEEWEPLVPVLKERRAHKERLRKAEELMRKLEDEGAKEAEAEEAAEEDPEWPCQEPQMAEAAPEDRGQADYLTEEGHAKRVGTLNSLQRQVYDKVTGIIQRQLQHEAAGTVSQEQVLEFVSGGAGTGKSWLIEVLREGVKLISGRSVLVAAPTGLAAQNVDGVTMHKAFKLPVQTPGNFAYTELSHEEDKEMASKMYKSKLIIIDEVSMVSNVTLMFVHQRLMGMLGKKDKSRFAGLNVLVLGDLLQLPPVDREAMDYCYKPIARRHWQLSFPNFPVNPFPKGLWQEFEYSELSENMRQKGHEEFVNLLNGLRVGKVAEAREILEQRLWKSPTGLEGGPSHVELLRKLKAEGQNPVCLLPLRVDATKLNTAMLVEDKVPVKFIHAVDTRTVREGKGRKQGGAVKDADMSQGYQGLIKYMSKSDKEDKKKTGNLAEVLALGVGARVMLTRNVDLDRGLFNGAMGVVKGLVESRKVKDHLVGVMVHFDDAGEDVVVQRSTASFQKSKGLMVTREQFSLELSYAITVHKSQGLSLDCVVADLGPDIFETGQAYVSLSRARSLEGLHLLAFEPGQVIYDQSSVKEYNRLRKLYTNLGPLDTGPPPKPAARPKVMRKTVDELMDVSPTLHQKTRGKKRKRDQNVTLTEEEAEEAGTEGTVSQRLRVLDEELRAQQAGRAGGWDEGEDDGITIEVLPLDVHETAEPKTRPSDGGKGSSEPWYMDIKELERRLAKHYPDRGPKSGWTLWQKPCLDAWARDPAEAEADRELIEKVAAQAMMPVEEMAPEMAESVESARAEPMEEHEEEQFGFVPLLNQHPQSGGVENICFGNATVQMLLSSSRVRAWLMSAEEAEMTAGGAKVKKELMKLLMAACSEDLRPRNVRAIRDAVAQFSVSLGGQNFANYDQHCAMEFVDRILSMCGEGLRGLVKFQRREMAKCMGRGCGAPERELMRTRDLIWTLYLDSGDGRRGNVSFKSLLGKDLSDEAKMRCPQCCDQAAKVMVRGKLVDNEGVKHRKTRTVEVLAEQKVMLVMVNPFYFDKRAKELRRSKKQLVGLEPDAVELAGRTWRVASGMEFIGERISGGGGHWVAYARQGHKWRRMSDGCATEVETLPVGSLYGILLELLE